MSGDFLTFVDISDATKGAYCPRQVYGATPEFKETEFYTSYCANVPCRGDIDCNRASCWKMLCCRGPYVQDENIKTQQKPISMDEFKKKLAEYACDCGVNFKTR